MSVSKRIEGVCFVREWPNASGQITFWCPGCESGHTVAFGGAETWSWNGSTDKPTFEPSVLALSRQKLNDAGKAEIDNAEREGRRVVLTDEHRMTTPRCHSFVRDGRIEYLSDSEHHLAGQTVDMVPLPDRYQKFLED